MSSNPKPPSESSVAAGVSADAAPKDPASKDIAPTGPFRSPAVRLGVSLLLAYHIAAVLLEPLATPPQFAGPPSVIPEALRPNFQAYTTALSLDHAYKFFAPNPGESHLVRYDLYFADGTKRVNQPDQWFPDRKRDWPRLLYHRYFMITEFLPDGRNFDNWNFEPTEPIPPAAAPGLPQVGVETVPLPSAEPLAGPPTGTFDPRSPADPPRVPTAQVYVRGIASFLARKHGASRVDVFHVVHRLSHPDEILRGRKLDEPDTYRERLLISYQAPEAKKSSVTQTGPTQTGAAAGEVRR